MGSTVVTTQREIAIRAKTSLKTVSRVINRDPLVNPKTRARIEAIIAEMGYEPSQAARMMRSQQSNIIGFLADGVATSTSSIDLIRGAQEVAWERGKQLMLFNIERDAPSAALADSQLAAFRAEAVIYAAIYHQQVDIPPRATPHVLLNCFDGQGRHPAVVPDDYQLAYDLTMFILERGYRCPVLLNLPPSSVASHLRGQGFIDAGASHGIDVSGAVHQAVVLKKGFPEYFVVDAILPSLFASGPRPDILICGQDTLAMNAYFVLSRMGLEIGKDIALASFDNLEPIASLLQPGLSTMELPYYEMGRVAMKLAIDGIANTEVIRVKGRLIERHSF